MDTLQEIYTAHPVIVATGVFNRRPPLSLQEHDRGLSLGLIRYCPVCDAYEVRSRRIAVVGSGRLGLAEARFLRLYSRSVTLTSSDGTTAVSQDDIGTLTSLMRTLALTDSEVIVTLHAGEIAYFDTLYVALGSTARTDLAAGLGVALAEGGCIVTDAAQQTDVVQLYAIGDLTNGLDQIAVAMSQGAVAATAIHNDLSARGAT